METSPPIKPPRGVKPGKETSGLLMSVIRTLSASETNEQRDREKAKIEAEYRRSDRKLDELVSKHDQDLTKVMQIFGTLSAHVNESRENIRRVKENLEACKVLLHCRRDELKKLWFEGLEYKYMLQLLEEIEQMTEVPNKLAGYLSRKHYLHATQVIVDAVSLGKGSLEGVEGIRELSTELDQKKQQLHVKLLEELRTHLYVKPAQEAVSLRRQGSGRDGMLFASPFQRSNEQRLSNRQRSSARKNLFEISQVKTENLKGDELKGLDIEEDVDLPDPEADTSHFMAILVKCLALLDKLPTAIDSIKHEMQNELLLIVHRTTLHVNDFMNFQSSAEVKNQMKQNALLELVQTLFEQFRSIAQAHAKLLGHLTRAVEKYNVETNLYDMKEFWLKVQDVLQLLLTDYLDIQNLSPDSQLSMVYNDSNDVSSYFSRRKVQTKKKGPLFKFDGSSSALTMNQLTNNDMNRVRGLREKVLVCTPDSANITLIFVPLMCFIEEIEHATGLKSGNMCPLNVFLSEYMNDKFLGRHRAQIQSQVDAAVRAPDAWKATTLPDTTRDTKPLLQSTVTVDLCIQESRELMRSLPLYGERILKDICNILREYRDTCLAAYRGIVQPHPEDRRICSAAWLKDEDISRFLKSLPNWLNLKSQQEAQARLGRHQRAPLRRECTEEESPEDVRLRNLREAEILASNLGEGGINAHEIISDMQLLRGLAQLQESMEWFAVRILQLASEFRQDPVVGQSPGANGVAVDSPPPPPVSSATLQYLTSTGQDFDELANTCLLVLHLEVRVQCFHYLLANSEYNRETQEPDLKVTELSRVLTNVDEAMSSCLHPRKCKYIFEGLGHLIAKILISSSQYMEHIDELGIQRMCRNVFALQQTLTNITMVRELALDHAKHYFELFYLTPEEILNGIMEKGPEFSELEYMNAFQLLNRSQLGKDQGMVNIHLEKLSDILGEVGVTV